jgi:hypothetical protein
VYGRPDLANRKKGLAIRDAVVGELKTIILDLINSSANRLDENSN